MPISLTDIERYYDTQQVFYTNLWSRSALHLGLWYSTTKDLKEAISNTDRLICQVLDIQSDDMVLDAGCGVGGTSFHIAQATRARVHGITLSQVQLEIARRECRRLGLEDRVRFSREDFCHATFNDESFSKVFGIESVSHALEKADFIAEAYRVLAHGGQLAVCDGFLARDRIVDTQDPVYARFLEGWALPNLTSTEAFSSSLKRIGFKEIEFTDLSGLVQRSVDRVHVHGLWTRPFSIIRSLGGSVRRDYPARYQKLLFDRGILVYGVFAARKT